MTTSDHVSTVLHVLAKSTVGGTRQLATEWARTLNNAGVSTTVVSLSGSSATAYPTGKQVDHDRLLHEIQSLEHQGKHSTIRTLLRLRRQIKQVNPEVIHAYFPVAEVYSRLASLGLKIPIIGTIVSSRPKRLPWYSRASLRSPCASLQISERWIAVGENVRTAAIARGMDGNRIDVVTPRIRDLPEIGPDQSLRVALGLDSNTALIIAVGRLHPLKGQDRIISALPHLRPNVHLLLAGPGGELSRLRSVANELNVSSRVHFLGPRNDISTLMNQSDVFVSASHAEGLVGYAVLEAVMSRLPVVVSDLPEIREVFSDQAVIYVDSGDPHQLAIAIDGALTKDMTKQIEHATDELRVRFDVERILEELLSAYKEARFPEGTPPSFCDRKLSRQRR